VIAAYLGAVEAAAPAASAAPAPSHGS